MILDFSERKSWLRRLGRPFRKNIRGLNRITRRFDRYFRRGSRRTRRWLRRRPWSRFKFALPAVLAITVLVLVLTAVLYVRSRSVAFRDQYHRLTRVSLAKGQYEVARVAALHGLAGEKTERARLEWLFYLALAMNGLGHEQEAADLLTAAAPVNRPGCTEAHLLAAQTFLNTTNPTLEKLQMVERHLRHAVTLEPRSVIANELLGRLYINLHQLEKSRACLIKIYAAKPETSLLLAVTYDLERDANRAVPWAERAITSIRNRLVATAPNASSADRLDLIHALLIKGKYASLPDPVERAMLSGTNALPQNSPPVWLDLVRGLKRAEKYGPALATLEQVSRTSPSPVYPPAIADICATWAEKIPAGQNAERLELIQKGLENASENLRLWWLLIQATHVSGKTGADAKELLGETMSGARGQATAWWYFLLWTDARTRGDMTLARSYLKTAYQLAPQIPQIQNDLAMDQSTSGSRADLEQSLTLIQPVVEKFPNHPGFRDTRGQILAKLGRYQEALADLQFAASRMPGSAGTREILTKVYAALGQSQTAYTNTAAPTLSRVHQLVLQANYERALATLEQANRANPSPAYPSAIAELCATWLEESKKIQPARRVELIQTGLTYDAANLKLRAALIVAAYARDDSGATAKKLLDQLVAAATGVSAAQWQWLLGREALTSGQPAVAKKHLQTAYQLAPDLTQIQGELARVLADGNPDDLKQGLALINSALDALPQSPVFRNTRGVILAQLGLHQEAVADLQYAAAKLPEPKATHLLLATVYEALNQPKLAEKHRRLAATGNRR